MKNRQLLNLLLLVLTLSIIAACASNHYVRKIPKEQYVVMLSLDGFRWDYSQLVDTPSLESIARDGVKMESLQPSFPSKTFPNHYSIATGLYPDNHGLVQNSFYDPEMDRYYQISDREAVEDGAFYAGEPIWVTAENQGLRTASFFWVGSEAPVQGIYPTRWKHYDHNFPYEARVDSVIAWLNLPKKERPRLITWYYPEPDGVGHRYSPESSEVKDMVGYLDSLVGDFLHKIDALPIADQINVIVTSDHGMARISGDKAIYFDELIEPTWLDTSIGSNPVWMFDPKEGYKDSVLLNLRKHPHLHVWEKDSIPEHLNYGSNPRVMEIVASPDINWSTGWSAEGGHSDYVGGTHGYEPQYKDMHGIFYARGPAFKEGYVHPTTENVNIYPLLAKILGLQPAETDGKLENVQHMMVPSMLGQ